MPARQVFLDTNGWIALLNSSDSLHPAAEAIWQDLLSRSYTVVLTDWILAETGNGLARTKARTQFPSAVEVLRSSRRARLLDVSDELARRALQLYASRPDKTWGLVDCASFVVMNDLGISEAFTTDGHFEQAGLRCLLPVA